MAKTGRKIRSVAFISLGCPKNLVDSERMLGLLASDGLAITADPREADAIVINTCGFLQASKEESLEEIRGAVELKKTGRCQRVVVAGCLVQREKTKLLEAVPGIDGLVGVFDRRHIVEAVRAGNGARSPQEHFLGKYHQLSRDGGGKVEFEDDRARLRLTPRHYAYLRISEGCNQGCRFCTIPSIRGPMRSKPLSQILVEARELAGDGVVELNLIGQDTTSYGQDISYQAGLAGLLRTLDKELADIPWIRLMYAYPTGFTDEMIGAIAESGRILKYIDLPLQHISDAILLRMRRRVTRVQTEELLNKLRSRIPGIAIRTTLITGTPGETDAQHQELVQFVREFSFDMLGVFPYSQEPGTAMGRLPDQLPDSVKQARLQELMLAQQEVAFAKAQGMVGRRLSVLIDSPLTGEGDAWLGRHAGQAPEIDTSTFVAGKDLEAGQMVGVQVTGSREYDLVGRPVGGAGGSCGFCGRGRGVGPLL